MSSLVPRPSIDSWLPELDTLPSEMDPRTYRNRQSANSSSNMGSIGRHNFPPNKVPNAYLLTRDFFPRREAYTAATKRMSQASRTDARRNTFLQQPQWHSYKGFTDTKNYKPRTQKRVHFAPTPQPSIDEPLYEPVSSFTSLYAFFAVSIILGTLSRCLSSAFTMIYTNCIALPATWEQAWYPWLKNVWTSFRAGYKVRPLPKVNRRARSNRTSIRLANTQYSTNRYYPSEGFAVSLRREPLLQNLKGMFARSVNIGKRYSVASFERCLQASSNLVSLLADPIAQYSSLAFTWAYKRVAFPRHTITRTPSSTSTTFGHAPARALGRRQHIAAEQNSSTLTSTAPIHASASASAHTPVQAPASAPSMFQSLVSVSRRFPRPKSLQRVRQWLASPSTTSSSHDPPSPKLPRIDLQVIMERKLLGNFHQFCEYFQYELRISDDTTEEEREMKHRGMQNGMKEVYDNPVLRMVEGKLGRAESPDQPAQVVHQVYWQGERAQMYDVLNRGLGNVASIQKISIRHCPIALSDIVGILVRWPSLDSLEIQDVIADEQADLLLPPPQKPDGTTFNVGNLTSLTLTSHAPLNEVFEDLKFSGLVSLSLHLHGEANYTRFRHLLSNLVGQSTRRTRVFQSFALRGRLPSEHCQELKALMGNDVGFDYEYL